jgi:serine/threonine-protein kinase RsbW
MRGERRGKLLRKRGAAFTEYLCIDGDPEAVTTGLKHVFSLPLMANLDGDCRGAVEIVLAEVLNNISEHAYAGHPGKIELWITAHETFLFVRVVDSGLPMPGGEVPGGALDVAAEIQDLPEGGFGWFLIRTLTHELAYLREGGHNTLSFCMDVDYSH